MDLVIGLLVLISVGAMMLGNPMIAVATGSTSVLLSVVSREQK